MAKEKGIIEKYGWLNIAGFLLLVTISLTYLAMGVDLIPDTIPFAGYIDDAALILVGLFILARYYHKRKKQ